MGENKQITNTKHQTRPDQIRSDQIRPSTFLEDLTTLQRRQNEPKKGVDTPLQDSEDTQATRRTEGQLFC